MKAMVKNTAIFILQLGLCYLLYCVGGVLIDGNGEFSWRLSYRQSPISFLMFFVFAAVTIVFYVRNIGKDKRIKST